MQEDLNCLQKKFERIKKWVGLRKNIKAFLV